MINKPTEDQLRQMYVLQRMTRDQIAKALGISSTTVLTYMKKYGIPRRSSGESLRGKTKSVEHRQKLSESKKGNKNPNFGKKRNAHGIRCWYTCPDGQVVSMRSKWEVWYAEWLKNNNIAYQYEPVTFILPDGSAYTPDFYLVAEDKFVEVKGWLTPKHSNKISAFRSAYPDKNFLLADRHYLESLGIDLRREWINTKPKFPCELCKAEYHRSYPSQRFCSVKCRNKAIAFGITPTPPSAKQKRRYNGSQSGVRNNSAKLNETTVREIRRLYDLHHSISDIARRTEVSPGNVSNIVHRRSWKNI